MRSFVPAIYDVTLAVPKGQPSPTMLRLFKGQPSVVSQTHLLLLWTIHIIAALKNEFEVSLVLSYIGVE